MASVNRVILIGNLGRDPEMRYMPSGDAVANFSIATTEKWKDKNGEMQEQTEWHRIAFFGRQAEICGEYLRKGSSVYVEGRLQTRKWTDKDGNERYTTEVRGDRMQMLGARGRCWRWARDAGHGLRATAGIRTGSEAARSRPQPQVLTAARSRPGSTIWTTIFRSEGSLRQLAVVSAASCCFAQNRRTTNLWLRLFRFTAAQAR